MGYTTKSAFCRSLAFRWVVSWTKPRLNACKNVDVTEYLNPHVYLQEREVNCVAAAALNVAVGRAVCGAAVEVDPEPRRTRQVMN